MMSRDRGSHINSPKKGEGAAEVNIMKNGARAIPSNFISIYIARGNDVAAVVYPHEMRQGYQSVKGGLICHIDPFIHVL